VSDAVKKPENVANDRSHERARAPAERTVALVFARKCRLTLFVGQGENRSADHSACGWSVEYHRRL